MRTTILATVLMMAVVGCEQGAAAPVPPPQQGAFLVGPSGETQWEVTVSGDTNCKGWMSMVVAEPYGCGVSGQVGHWVCSNEAMGLSGYLSGHSIGGVEAMTLTKGGAATFALTGSYSETLIEGTVPDLGALFRAERR